MIDDLIFDQMKEIWSYISKVINFLIFRDFLDFSKFLMIFLNYTLNFLIKN